MKDINEENNFNGYISHKIPRKNKRLFKFSPPINLNLLDESKSLENWHNTKRIDEQRFKEQKEKLYRALDKLTLKQKVVVNEIYFKQKTQVEVALSLGITQQSVQELLSKALKNIKKFINKGL